MKILQINASTRGPESQSLSVAENLIAKLKSGPGVSVDTMDLFDGSLPAFDANAVGAKMALFTGAEATAAQKETWATVEKIFQRFAAADVYVVNTPLWNNGIPYVLKQLIDLVTQPGWTFGFDPEKGYNGLLTGKRAFVVHASGVYYNGISPNFGSDFATPYLDDWFKFIGVADVEHIHVAPTVVNADYSTTKAEAIVKAEAAAAAA
ncbi:FMN-dependent NADH-azoreductase [Pseudosulfitobacter koreensis]|uniref:FMN dependent NADH:quinone oxidoreductase n=1 Tax=Pseudosulfitobacter koreensis TaxID=2968472 RepID=A0ABT1Z4F9_9RHOB|nr:NAD(P)H-dependent oxidoreductase [Pseudosulfitobacter koreense]MCR8827998.1 NAD(P)H-dependent oxidoreductase [Pseudosulfitobacter koreense]